MKTVIPNDKWHTIIPHDRWLVFNPFRNCTSQASAVWNGAVALWWRRLGVTSIPRRQKKHSRLAPWRRSR